VVDLETSPESLGTTLDGYDERINRSNLEAMQDGRGRIRSRSAECQLTVDDQLSELKQLLLSTHITCGGVQEQLVVITRRMDTLEKAVSVAKPQ
jgi:hypothetical protein